MPTTITLSTLNQYNTDMQTEFNKSIRQPIIKNQIIHNSYNFLFTFRFL